MSITQTRAAGAASEVVTPPTRSRLRRAAPWIAIALVLVVTAIVIVVGGSRPDRVPWGPDDPSPVGSKAYVQVLRQQGVHVTATDSLADTRRAITDRADTTIVLVNQDGYLYGSRLRRVSALAAHVVLIEPGFATLDALAPGVRIRGTGSGTASGCRLGGVAPSDLVRATGARYTLAADVSATACLGSAGRGYGFVRLETTASDGRSTRVDVVGAGPALRNGHALEHADAAFALAVLGQTPDAVWYIPSPADLPASSDLPTELLPTWWPPVAVLLMLVALAVVIWRARRLGPLAVENLPVIVPASETMEGRARLYARSSTRLHALDALRIGTIDRLAGFTGLPRSATVDEVIDATAAATGRPRGDLAALLRDAAPTTDAELVRLAGALQDLERETHERMTP